MIQSYNTLLSCASNLFPDKVDKGYYQLYLQYVKDSEDEHQLELSKKVRGTEVSNARQNIFFVRNIENNLFRFLNLLHKLGFDDDKVYEFIYRTPFCLVEYLVLGIEVGDTPASTKFRIYLRYKSSPRIKEYVLNYPDTNPAVGKFIDSANVMIGFDLYPDKRTIYRVYLSYRNPKDHYELLSNQLGKDVADKLTFVDAIWLAWKQQSDEIFAYWCDSSTYTLNQIINNLYMENIGLDSRGYKPYIVGFPLNDLGNRFASEYNLYYIL